MPPKEENLHPDVLPFVYNEMSDAERQAFEQKINSDAELKSQVLTVTADLESIRQKSANPTLAIPTMPTYITHNILAAATRQADSLRYGEPAAPAPSPSALSLWLARAFRPAASVAFSAILVFSVALFFNQQRARNTFETVAQVDLSQVAMRKATDPLPDEIVQRRAMQQSASDSAVLNLNVQTVGLKREPAQKPTNAEYESMLPPNQRAATRLHKQALQFLEKGQPERAAAMYNTLLTTHPDYMALPGVYFESAKVLLGLKQYREARLRFEKVIQINPYMRENIQPFLQQIDAAEGTAASRP